MTRPRAWTDGVTLFHTAAGGPAWLVRGPNGIFYVTQLDIGEFYKVWVSTSSSGRPAYTTTHRRDAAEEACRLAGIRRPASLPAWGPKGAVRCDCVHCRPEPERA